MNYDLITKLAKLANNNPSENEANAAARKVCKLLAEAEYKFNGHAVTPPVTPPRPAARPTRATEDIFNDLFGGSGWRKPFERDSDWYKNPPPPKQEPPPLKKYTCKYCKGMFNSRSFEGTDFVCGNCYLFHKEHKPPVQQLFKCKRCGVEFYSSTINLNSNSYLCYKCRMSV